MRLRGCSRNSALPKFPEMQVGIFGRMESALRLFCFQKYLLFNVSPATLNISQFFSFVLPSFYSLQLLQIGLPRLIDITCREITYSFYYYLNICFSNIQVQYYILILLFIPCVRKYSQSEYRKACVYSTVLHPTFSSSKSTYCYK